MKCKDSTDYWMSERISIVIPTIKGRESWLEKCLEGYKQTAPLAEVIIIRDAPSCGVAWEEGYAQTTRPYIHFTADDIVPCRDWYREALKWLDLDTIPAANVRNQRGGPNHCDSPLGEMGHVPNILVPLLKRHMIELGGWFQPFHYGTDDWITYRAVQLGYPVERCWEYKVTHFVAPEGRDYLRRPLDVKMLADAMTAAGYLPPVYAELVERLKDSETGLDSVSLRQLQDKQALQVVRV